MISADTRSSASSYAEVGYVRSGEKHSTLSQRFRKPEERTVGEDIGNQKAYLTLGS